LTFLICDPPSHLIFPCPQGFSVHSQNMFLTYTTLWYKEFSCFIHYSWKSTSHAICIHIFEFINPIYFAQPIIHRIVVCFIVRISLNTPFYTEPSIWVYYDQMLQNVLWPQYNLSTLIYALTLVLNLINYCHEFVSKHAVLNNSLGLCLETVRSTYQYPQDY